MPAYRYVATDVLGTRVTGKYEGSSEKEVQVFLSKKNLTPVRIRRDFLKTDIEIGSSKVKQKDLLLFTKMFSVLVRTNVPSDQALRILQRQTTSKPLKKALHEVIVKTEAGGTVAEAMRSQPQVFDEMYTNMVASAEASGNMDTLLIRLADLLYRMNAIRTKIKGAMVYPAALGIVAVLAVVALLVFVMPKFRDFFSGMDLPLPTRIVMGAGDALANYWMYMLGAIAISVFGAKRLFQNKEVVRARDRLFLKMPIIKDVIIKQGIARLSRTLATLIASGVSVIDGLEMTRGLTGNAIISDAITTARASLTAGGQLSVALEESGIFPALVTSMIDIGEQTGQLENMLEEIAQFYEDELNAAVDAMLKLIEPIMLVVLGSIVGLILMSLYLPLFNMIQAIDQA